MLSIILNLLSPEEKVLSPFHFYLLGLPYLVFALFCLHTYRSRVELCFYCKYALIQNPLVLLAMMLVYLERVPVLYLYTFIVAVVGSLVVRGIARKERAK